MVEMEQDQQVALDQILIILLVVSLSSSWETMVHCKMDDDDILMVYR